MNSVNRIMLIGRLGADPELRDTDAGKVLTFSLATTEKWTDREGTPREKTEWHRVAFWKQKAAEQLARMLFKGGRAFVEGTLRTREFRDRDGNKRTTTEVHADYIIALDRQPRQSDPNEGGSYADDDPIPF